MADRIRSCMALHRVSVKRMARTFGISERTWSNWMRSPETQLSVARLRVIAAVLETTVEYLIGE